MKVKIEAIFPPDEKPRYIFGKKSSDEFVVFSPLDNQAEFCFDLDDIIKFNLARVSLGPVEANNETKKKTVRVGIHDICISKDVVRVRYDANFA